MPYTQHHDPANQPFGSRTPATPDPRVPTPMASTCTGTNGTYANSTGAHSTGANGTGTNITGANGCAHPSHSGHSSAGGAAVSGTCYVPTGAPVIPESAAVFFYRPPADPALALETFERLDPAERKLVEHAAPKRQADFGDARYCAHEALRLLGKESGEPILRGERGMPLWPRNVVGSISHTEGLRGAIVAPRSKMRTIGLDIERWERLETSLVHSISSEQEREMLTRLRRDGLIHPETLLFSAKEALYKAWFPVARRWLDFQDASVELTTTGEFVAQILLDDAPIHQIRGRWQVLDGFIISTAYVPSRISWHSAPR